MIDPIQKAAPAATPQATPAAPSTPSALTGLPEGLTRPLTREDVRLLQSRRTELTNQLRSVQGRRDDVVQEMRRTAATVDAPGRAGLQARLDVLDQRLIQLEKEIAQNSQLIASAPPNLVTETSPAPSLTVNGGRPVNLTAVSLALIFAVGVPMTITWCIRQLRRSRGVQPAELAGVQDRLARIETAVDSIALEVERISEGQRFVTKLMNEGKMIGAGAAEPIAMEQREKLGERR